MAPHSWLCAALMHLYMLSINGETFSPLLNVLGLELCLRLSNTTANSPRLRYLQYAENTLHPLC